MRQQGRLVSWDDDRGFGFIEADGTGERIFVHIKSIAAIATRPRLGDRMSYAIGAGRDGRAAAHDVVIGGANPRQRDAARRGLPPEPVYIPGREWLRVGLAIGLLGLALLAVAMGRAPAFLVWFYLAMGLVSAVVYWSDKRAAQASNWRVPEATLHFVDLAGGVVGGLVAQAILRHKTLKTPFAVQTYAILALHLGALALLFAGVWQLHT